MLIQWTGASGNVECLLIRQKIKLLRAHRLWHRQRTLLHVTTFPGMRYASSCSKRVRISSRLIEVAIVNVEVQRRTHHLVLITTFLAFGIVFSCTFGLVFPCVFESSADSASASACLPFERTRGPDSQVLIP